MFKNLAYYKLCAGLVIDGPVRVFMALFFRFLSNINTKAMAENNRNQDDKGGVNKGSNNPNESIGNQQHTTQTGGQNAGGENIDQEEDQYTEDMRQYGDRNRRNRKTNK